jgi:heme exporter protein B
MSPGFLGTVWTVLRNDVRAELRAKETLLTMLLFGVVLAFVFAFGFTNDPVTNRRVFPGAVWGALFFTGALGVGRTFAREAEDGAFAALVLSPASRSAILFAKVITNVLLIVLVMTFVIPLLSVMLRVDLEGTVPTLIALVSTGAIGFGIVGTPLAVMAVSARFPEVLLPIVVFPMVTPILIAGVNATGITLGTAIGDSPWPWLQFMWGFGLIFGLLGLGLFDRMVTE